MTTTKHWQTQNKHLQIARKAIGNQYQINATAIANQLHTN